MLDKSTEEILRTASQLTAEDLEVLRATTPVTASASPEPLVAEDEPVEAEASVAVPRSVPAELTVTGSARGKYERQRTRESKVSTSCVGHERLKHEWWPVGTELVGRIGAAVFTAEVIENPQVKSGRSVRITSGPASGQICHPATHDYPSNGHCSIRQLGGLERPLLYQPQTCRRQSPYDHHRNASVGCLLGVEFATGADHLHV